MQIQNDSVVTMHYLVSTSDGTELDSSFDGEPLVFIHGTGHLIPGLETALVGKTAGEKFSVDVAAADAYGDRHEQLVQAVPKDMFEGMEVEVGLQFRASSEAGEQSVVVVDVSDDKVVVDGNHPLAGKDLSFEVEVVSVREATADELDHGHVHGAGGCDH
ncbi:MAG: peptidylprolyl isomerase [Aestuariibacter sp.]